ncbi:hypothetical protein [Actinoplanes sp. CA-252034]|uniref:hypothetical protein n=1 Tax=Actinoplanes sp. CA-252034 TaxID=3239906 RepID=UPI003D9712D1
MHSRYQRRLADLPVAGRLVELCLTARRFFCSNTACELRTFVEQVSGPTRRRARRSEPLRAMLTSIGRALAGRDRPPRRRDRRADLDGTEPSLGARWRICPWSGARPGWPVWRWPTHLPALRR